MKGRGFSKQGSTIVHGLGYLGSCRIFTIHRSRAFGGCKGLFSRRSGRRGRTVGGSLLNAEGQCPKAHWFQLLMRFLSNTPGCAV